MRRDKEKDEGGGGKTSHVSSSLVLAEYGEIFERVQRERRREEVERQKQIVMYLVLAEYGETFERVQRERGRE